MSDASSISNFEIRESAGVLQSSWSNGDLWTLIFDSGHVAPQPQELK